MADNQLKDFNKIKKLIKDAHEAHGDAESSRSEINHTLQEHLEAMEARGISRKAFRMCRAYLDLSETDRKGFDTAYHVCREALGSPVQADLFDEITERAAAFKAAKDAKDGAGPLPELDDIRSEDEKAQDEQASSGRKRKSAEAPTLN